MSCIVWSEYEVAAGSVVGEVFSISVLRICVSKQITKRDMQPKITPASPISTESDIPENVSWETVCKNNV